MTFDDVRKIALAWPEVEDGTSYGTPALKVRKKLLARLREDNDSLVMPGVFRHTFNRHPEEPRACAASRRTAAGTCGSSFEARREERRAPQDDGGMCGGNESP